MKISVFCQSVGLYFAQEQILTKCSFAWLQQLSQQLKHCLEIMMNFAITFFLTDGRRLKHVVQDIIGQLVIHFFILVNTRMDIVLLRFLQRRSGGVAMEYA